MHKHPAVKRVASRRPLFSSPFIAQSLVAVIGRGIPAQKSPHRPKIRQKIAVVADALLCLALPSFAFADFAMSCVSPTGRGVRWRDGDELRRRSAEMSRLSQIRVCD